ncbi:hypothetical protein DL96DRAFT_1714269 [Flagelloscypha sp. PMI_526]|nr:hypothetical protein DL96DRAFT_1714269 [Flagelloscypha sp. PMI_526]
MRSTYSHIIFALLFLFSQTYVAAFVHTVTVGLEGSFFNPAVIAAQKDDIVQFVFAGDNHGVVQADKDKPCVPKDGGFSSGLSGLKGNSSATPQVWELTVDDTSGPIWFYCPAVQPTSHCNAGMVGVINPPSIDDFNDYSSRAKLFANPTGAPQTSVALTGVGAHATAKPAVPGSTSVQPSSLITSTLPTSTGNPATSSPSPTVASSSSSGSSSGASKHAGAIAGGVIGGIAFLVILGVAAFFGKQYLKRRRRASRNFFEYEGQVTPGMTERGRLSVEQPSTIASMSAPSQQSQMTPRNLFGMP